MASASAYPRSDSRLPDGSVYSFPQVGRHQMIADDDSLRPSADQRSAKNVELRHAIKKFNESRRREAYDHQIMDDDWMFPNIVSAAKLNIATEVKCQRRLIATYGTQVLRCDSSKVSDPRLLELYHAFLAGCTDPLSDEQVETRFQFMDRELHKISLYAREMEENEPHKDRYSYYMEKWQKAKAIHDELTTKFEEFISQHGRQIVSDLI
jgi:hypothetical protein